MFQLGFGTTKNSSSQLVDHHQLWHDFTCRLLFVDVDFYLNTLYSNQTLFTTCQSCEKDIIMIIIEVVCLHLCSMVTFSFLRILVQVNQCMTWSERLSQTSMMSNCWLKHGWLRVSWLGFQEIWWSALLIKVLLTIDHRNESDAHKRFLKTLYLSIKLWCVTHPALFVL